MNPETQNLFCGEKNLQILLFNFPTCQVQAHLAGQALHLPAGSLVPARWKCVAGRRKNPHPMKYGILPLVARDSFVSQRNPLLFPQRGRTDQPGFLGNKRFILFSISVGLTDPPFSIFPLTNLPVFDKST